MKEYDKKKIEVIADCMIEKIPELKRYVMSITEDENYAVLTFDCGDEDVLDELAYEYALFMQADVIESFSIMRGYINVIVFIPAYFACLCGFQLLNLNWQ